MEDGILERYYQTGVLSIEEGRWRAEDRLRAGTLLYRDFVKSGRIIRTMDPSRPRVDCQGFKHPSESREVAEDRFNKAIRNVSFCNWAIVQHVALEKERIPVKGKSREMVYALKRDLCCVLYEFCDFYFAIKMEKIKP